MKGSTSDLPENIHLVPHKNTHFMYIEHVSAANKDCLFFGVGVFKLRFTPDNVMLFFLGAMISQNKPS